MSSQGAALNKHTGVTAMVIGSHDLTQLCPSLTGEKRVLGFCWRSVADDGSILNRHWITDSAVEGGSFHCLRDYPLKSYTCEGHLCSRFEKYCSINNLK